MEHKPKSDSPRTETCALFDGMIAERILVLDGAMGTMIQRLSLGEHEFRGSQYADHGRDLVGCNDALSLTQPEAITGIHRAYLDAGADIICTNTFNANSISLADYDLADDVRPINRAAVECARKAVTEAFCRGVGAQMVVKS